MHGSAGAVDVQLSWLSVLALLQQQPIAQPATGTVVGTGCFAVHQLHPANAVAVHVCSVILQHSKVWRLNCHHFLPRFSAVGAHHATD